MKPKLHRSRILWGPLIFLVVIGATVVVRRMLHLIAIIINGYNPPTSASNPALRQLVALDDIFARHPVLMLLHILSAPFFVVLAPLQFSQTFRERHLRWRLNGRIHRAHVSSAAEQ